MNNEKNIDKVGSFFDEKIETHLFKIKYLIILAVIGSALLSVVLFLSGLYEVFLAVLHLIQDHNFKEFTLNVLKCADMFLFGMVMIIFTLGTYNLFISKLDNIDLDPKSKEILPEWLAFNDFGQLKALFIKVIILILAITFLELVIQNLDTFSSEKIYSILVIPVGIVLIAYSLKIIENIKH